MRNGLLCCIRWFLVFNFVNETPLCDHSNESYIEQHFHVMLIIMPYTVYGGFNFKSVDETLVSDHSNDSC